MLDALNDGKVIRSSIANSLKALAILSLVGGIYLLIDVLKASFDLSTEGTIGGLIFSAFLVASIITVAQMLFYRASNIQDLRDSSFTVIPISSILFRAFGEAYAIFGIAVGVGGCVFMWLAKNNPLYLLGEVARFLPTVTPEETFLGGVFFLVYFALMSFVTFVVSYFLAESIIVMTDTAKNIRHLIKQS
jgi:hypothetical protein